MCDKTEAKNYDSPTTGGRGVEAMAKEANRLYEIHILNVIGGHFGSRQVEERYGPYSAEELIAVQHALMGRTYKVVTNKGRVLYF